MSNFPISYKNGNCIVTLQEDGTKIREWPDGEMPTPCVPESIDLKITNSCDLGCPWCHESSIKNDAHAKTQHIRQIVNGLPPGVELALGGGNLFEHPYLEHIVCYLSMKYIVNLTVNAAHLRERTQINEMDLRALVYFGTIHGIGVSYDQRYERDILELDLPNVVIHLIVGVHSPCLAVKLLGMGKKVLVLGYKRYGRGASYRIDDELICEWSAYVPRLITEGSGTIAFDTLALQQLHVRKRLTERTWNSLYMGDDGQFTMYIDAVKMEFAASSTSRRVPLPPGMTAIQAFRQLHKVDDGGG